MERLNVEFPSSASQLMLGHGEEVVAVDDAFAIESVLRTDGHLSGKATNGAGNRGDDNLREQRDRTVASQDDDRATSSRQLDVVDRASIQRGSPPSAR